LAQKFGCFYHACHYDFMFSKKLSVLYRKFWQNAVNFIHSIIFFMRTNKMCCCLTKCGLQHLQHMWEDQKVSGIQLRWDNCGMCEARMGWGKGAFRGILCTIYATTWNKLRNQWAVVGCGVLPALFAVFRFEQWANSERSRPSTKEYPWGLQSWDDS
jgi:hypothetical protein